jgi:lipopolysaccharide transport system ATP-binding protein
MYVRLAFAVAAHLEPDILIVDEVLAVGDAEFQKKCLGKMKDVSAKDGRTILFVSHNMPPILNLCNKAMVLEFGKIIYAGETEDSVQFYLNNRKPKQVYAIAERKDRAGNGTLRCINIKLLNDKFEQVESVKSGDALQVQLDYELADKPVRSVYFRIQVVDSNEAVLFTCNNEHTAGTIDIIEQSGNIVCNIPKLPLFGGNYYINVQVFSREQGLLDEVEFAKELHVVDGDFFGTGRIPVVKKGMLIAHSWKMNG